MQLIAIKFLMKYGHFITAILPYQQGMDIVSKYQNKKYPLGTRLSNEGIIANSWAWAVDMDEVTAIHTLDANQILLQLQMERQQVQQVISQQGHQSLNPFSPKFSGQN